MLLSVINLLVAVFSLYGWRKSNLLARNVLQAWGETLETNLALMLKLPENEDKKEDIHKMLSLMIKVNNRYGNDQR